MSFEKGMRKKYSHTLKDNFILNKADNQSFEIVAKRFLPHFEGEIENVQYKLPYTSDNVMHIMHLSDL